MLFYCYQSIKKTFINQQNMFKCSNFAKRFRLQQIEECILAPCYKASRKKNIKLNKNVITNVCTPFNMYKQ